MGIECNFCISKKKQFHFTNKNFSLIELIDEHRDSRFEHFSTFQFIFFFTFHLEFVCKINLKKGPSAGEMLFTSSEMPIFFFKKHKKTLKKEIMRWFGVLRN